ncbi:hypothetical protein BayCH28_12700 [Mycolicibacterium sp. CH28]|uniref:hypothetical protein n=1 Tax=Mycolicibacterium sp. CH28 TaxID=2512237 RepID=UPI0010813A47|nr:hypothetical protein [Mycolicibacterium sp. CH28]TGD88564.1 hypothetical protein BayCH28_12700 [Mycolicibacterium sp. CH28]
MTPTIISDTDRAKPVTATPRNDGGVSLHVDGYRGGYRVILNGRETQRLIATITAAHAAQEHSHGDGLVFSTRSRPPILRYQASDPDIAKTPS